MAFDKENVPLLYSYNVQAQSKHRILLPPALMFLKLNINDLNVITKVVCVYGKCLLKKSVSVPVNSDAPSMRKNN